MAKAKSPIVAGFLGVFLGAFGVHNWYLGKKKLAIAQGAITLVGLILLIIGCIIDLATQNSLRRQLGLDGTNLIIKMFIILGFTIFTGVAIWGAVEGFIMLARNRVATAVATVAISSTPISHDKSKPAASQTTTPTASAAPAVKPIDPKTKKTIILVASLVGGGVILLAVAILIISALLHVDYGETYRVAKELKEQVYSLYRNSDCEDVVDDVDSYYVSESTYERYIKSCKEAISSDNDLVNKLGNTSGVRRNAEIKAQFDVFREAYEAALPTDKDIASKLDVYQAWHAYIYRQNKLAARDSESDYRNAAKLLADSGNTELKKYGEEWLKVALAYRAAYLNFYDNDNAGSAEREAMNTARNTLQRFVRENQPDIEDILPLEFGNFRTAYNEYDDLYDLITKTYADHYNYGSDDCTEFLDEVYCY